MVQEIRPLSTRTATKELRSVPSTRDAAWKKTQSDLLFAQHNIRPGLVSSPGQDTPCFESEVEVQAWEVKKDVGGEVVRIAGDEDDYWRQA